MTSVFFGTPDWAVPSLHALLGSPIEVAAVVTNPDRPAGRGMKLRASPVKQGARAAGIEVHQPGNMRDPGVAAWLRELAPDVCVVVAYGKILPPELLEIPRLGFVNLHFSLLPRWRGAAPVQRAVMDGGPHTGISIMILTEGMDEGPVLAQERVTIGTDETSGELGARLARIGAPVLVDALQRYAQGDLTPQPQDDERATYAAKISPAEARIEWAEPSQRIKDKVRGLAPVPGAWTVLEDLRLKIFRVGHSERDGLAPGELLNHAATLHVGTGDGAVEILDAQLAGKQRMSGSDLARGLRAERVRLRDG